MEAPAQGIRSCLELEPLDCRGTGRALQRVRRGAFLVRFVRRTPSFALARGPFRFVEGAAPGCVAWER